MTGGAWPSFCATMSKISDEAMLNWPAGPKPFDGVWAPHWYNAAWASTGFAKPEPKPIELNHALAKIADAARPYYEVLKTASLSG